MSASLLFFAQAEAFRRCDLNKGRRFVEPMCASNGRALSLHTALVIDGARSDAIVYAYNGFTPLSIVNPYHEESVAFGLYANVAHQAIEEDYTPYETERK